MSLRKSALTFIILSSSLITAALMLVEVNVFMTFRDKVLYTQADEMYQAMIDTSISMGTRIDSLINLMEPAFRPVLTGTSSSAATAAGLAGTWRNLPGIDPGEGNHIFLVLGLDGKPASGQILDDWEAATIADPDFQAVFSRAVTDHQPRLVWSPRPGKDLKSPLGQFPDMALTSIFHGPRIALMQHINMDSTRFRIAYLKAESDKTITWLGVLTAIITLTSSVLLALAATWFINARFLKPIARIRQIMDSFATLHNDARWAGAETNEFGQLGRAFNTMADELMAYQSRLEEVLGRRSDELREVRRQAAFGSLMAAGVAHDIKSPLSSVNTALSWLRESTVQLQDSFGRSAMTRQELQDYLTQVMDSLGIMDSALGKAINLSRGFKDVIADQFTSQARPIMLLEYLRDIVLSLKPRLKTSGAVVDLVCPEHLSITCDPGALSQVLINLMENSLVHGFEPLRTTGDPVPFRITIEVQVQADDAIVHYRDDGKGMSHEAKEKLFEKMYTSRRGQGGTGYGMVMLRELVNNSLHGSIRFVEDPPDGLKDPGRPGVHFEIILPLLPPPAMLAP